MKRPTLAEARALGRDPLSVLRADRAVLLDGEWLSRIAAGAPMMFWGEDDDEEKDDAPESTPYELLDGVAVLDIEGPIAQRGWFCVDGYDTIAKHIDCALADARVRTLLLRINSPGGAAAGAFEYTSRMRDAVVASKKRCVAYADEMALSGAYAVACVADEIVVPETGIAGSIGVITSLTSFAKMNELEGIDVRVIYAGDEKADGHPDMPISDGAVARTQREVDLIAGVFARRVAERRGIPVADVVALQAGVRMGVDAVAARLADRVLGYHALVAELRAASLAAPSPPRGPLSPFASARRAPSTEHDMDETTLTALRAATNAEADADTAVLALLAAHEKNAGDLAAARKTITELSGDLAAAIDRARAAEGRIETIERDAELSGAKAEGKWSAALDGFLATLSVEQLRAWRAGAPRVVPQGEVKAPTAPVPAAGTLPEKIAAAVAKARDKGWSALTAREKHVIATHDKALASELQKPAQD